MYAPIKIGENHGMEEETILDTQEGQDWEPMLSLPSTINPIRRDR